MAIDPSFEFEKRRHVPVKYNRELWVKTIDAMKKVEEIRQKRSNNHIMQRLRKGREVEWQKDVREVQRDISLIRYLVIVTLFPYPEFTWATLVL